MVSYRHGQGWLVASDPRSGEQGLVPEAYVRLIAEMPNYDPETGQFVDLDDETSPIDASHDDLDASINTSNPSNTRQADSEGIIPVDEEHEVPVFHSPGGTSSAEHSPSPVRLSAPKLEAREGGETGAKARPAEAGS